MQAKVEGVIGDNRNELSFAAGAGVDFATVRSTQGDVALTIGAPSANPFLVSGSQFSNFSRLAARFDPTVTLNVSGTMGLVAISLPAGIVVTSMSFCSGTTGATGPTNQLFGLYDSARLLLVSSVNDGATAWGANTVKTLAMTAPFTTTYDGLYYAAIMVTVSTTMPTVLGNSVGTTVHLNLAPILNGASNTGLTTALPAGPATAITGSTQIPWVYVS